MRTLMFIAIHNNMGLPSMAKRSVVRLCVNSPNYYFIRTSICLRASLHTTNIAVSQRLNLLMTLPHYMSSLPHIVATCKWTLMHIYIYICTHLCTYALTAKFWLHGLMKNERVENTTVGGSTFTGEPYAMVREVNIGVSFPWPWVGYFGHKFTSTFLIQNM